MRVVIVGAAGRMGRELRSTLDEFPSLELLAAIDREADAASGITTGLDAALVGAHVMIDFSSPQTTVANLESCAARGVAALVGTTGLGPEVEAAAAAAARRIPVLIAANTSLGVTLLVELVRAAARALPSEFDIEIAESHHRHKKDAPSGTALALGRAAAAGRGVAFDEVRGTAREGEMPRRAGEIGFAVTRGGDIVGEHAVVFAGAGERVSLGHVATDRKIFARGALTAASWLAGKAAGRYEMSDIIGSKSTI